jgi:predicted DNA-binding WGR domain protein
MKQYIKKKGENTMRLEYKNETENAFKFWEVKIEAKKKLIVKYGRIGIKNPATKTFIFPTTNPKEGFKTKEDAEKYREKKIKEKISKGYVEIN